MREMRLVHWLAILVLTASGMEKHVADAMNHEMAHQHEEVTLALKPGKGDSKKPWWLIDDAEQAIDALLRSYKRERIMNDLALEAAVKNIHDILKEPHVAREANSEEFNRHLIQRLITSFNVQAYGQAYLYVSTAVNLGTKGAHEWLKTSIVGDSAIKEAAAELLFGLSHRDDNLEKVQFLIDAGSPINSLCWIIDGKKTALMAAVNFRQEKTVQTLLDAHADVLLVDDYGKSAFEHTKESSIDKKDEENPAKRNRIISLLKKAALAQMSRLPHSYLKLLPADIRNEIIEHWCAH